MIKIVKRFVTATCCLLLLVALVSPPLQADDLALADQLLESLSKHRPPSDQLAAQQLAQLQELIPAEDSDRRVQLVAASCWHQPDDSKKQLTKALGYAEQLLLQATPGSQLALELQLCKAKYAQHVYPLGQVVELLSRTIEGAQQQSNPSQIARGRAMRGALLSFQGGYSAAFEDLINAQQLFEQLGFDYWATLNLVELASSYRRAGDAQTALNYQLSLEQRYITEQQLEEANDINIQIAASYEQLGQLDKAISRYRTSQAYLAESQPIYAADISMSVAINLLAMGDAQQALEILLEAAKVITLEHSASYSFLQLYLGKTYLSIGRLNEAINASKTAELVFQSNNHLRGLRDSYQLSSQVYSQMGDWRQAFSSLQSYHTLYQQLERQSHRSHNSAIRARFDADKMQQLNSLLLENAKEREVSLQLAKRSEVLQQLIIALVVALLLLVSIFAHRQVSHTKRFQQLALTDELTGINNRRGCYQQAERLLMRAQSSRAQLALIGLDADHFKQVNDSYGHDIGDQVLINLASIAKELTRPGDVLGRVGGEEFVLVLPDTHIEQACEIAERILQAAREFPWEGIAPGLQQTFSAGVVSLRPQQDLSALLVHADRALYQAKKPRS